MLLQKCYTTSVLILCLCFGRFGCWAWTPRTLRCAKVHRLDVGTTGSLLLAKKLESFRWRAVRFVLPSQLFSWKPGDLESVDFDVVLLSSTRYPRLSWTMSWHCIYEPTIHDWCVAWVASVLCMSCLSFGCLRRWAKEQIIRQALVRDYICLVHGNLVAPMRSEVLKSAGSKAVHVFFVLSLS